MYDPLTTVRLVTDARTTGTIATPRHEAIVGCAALLDVAGIAVWQDTLRFNGTRCVPPKTDGTWTCLRDLWTGAVTRLTA